MPLISFPFLRTAVPVFDDEGPYELPNIDEDFAEEVDDKIIGGTETSIENHPYQVNLRLRNRFICGGSVLSETRSLTAAHCVSSKNPASAYSIMAGSTLRTGDSNQQIRPISKYIIHPQYRPGRNPNDVAVLQFELRLIFGATVRPIRLAAQGVAAPYGQNVNVTGWGTTVSGNPGSISNRLRVTSKPLVSNEECNRAYHGRITADMLCAGAPQGGRDACQGDSGGPLTFNGVQLGVVSWGRGCGLPRVPGVYARVSYFSKWIASHL